MLVRTRGPAFRLGVRLWGFPVVCADTPIPTIASLDKGNDDVVLRVAMQYLSCALVRGRGIVFRRYYQGTAKSAGKDFRDGEKVTSTRARKQALVA